MSAAQRLATATSIDLAVARSHADKRTPAQTPVQRTITIGTAGTRGLRTYVQLFVVIAAANDVRCDIASNSTFVYAYGFAEDIDATHALYASLVVQMVRASDSYISSGEHRPTPTITARLNFQLAFGARVGQRLARGPRADAKGSKEGQASSAWNRNCLAEQRIRTSRTTTAPRRRRAAPGRPAGRLRGIRRRRDGRGTGPVSGPAWAAAPSCPERGPRWNGERRAGRPARQGLRRRGIRPHALRPCRRARLHTASSSSGRN